MLSRFTVSWYYMTNWLGRLMHLT